MRVHKAARHIQAQLDGLGYPRQEIDPAYRQSTNSLSIPPCMGSDFSGLYLAQIGDEGASVGTLLWDGLERLSPGSAYPTGALTSRAIFTRPLDYNTL